MRGGVDCRLPRDPKTGAIQHTIYAVYSEMLLQICCDYPGLPDPRTLTMEEIRFFYNGGRAALKQATKPREKLK